MFRHIAEPFDAGGLQGGVRVQPFGDGVGDDGLAFFFQQFNQPPLLPHQPVNLRRLAVKKRRDLGLFVRMGQYQEACAKFFGIQMRLGGSHLFKVDLPFLQVIAQQCELNESWAYGMALQDHVKARDAWANAIRDDRGIPGVSTTANHDDVARR